MKRFAWIAACLLVPQLAQAAPTCLKRSQDLLAALKAHDYAAATRNFDDEVRAMVTVDRLRQVWEQALPTAYGAYDPKAPGQAAQATAGGSIVTPLHFQRAWLHMHVACNARGEISGFRFLPGKAGNHDAQRDALKAASGPWGHSQRVSVRSPWGPLPGLLTLPGGKGPFPAVVLVAGSGPQNANEQIGPNRPFEDIARGLAAQGVASLRYDKRTYAYPARAEKDAGLGIDDEVTDDALAAVKQLKHAAHVDPRRVFVLGHSLGAMLAPRIGQRAPGLAGLIMMAAPTRSLLDVIAWQTRELGPGMGQSPAQVAAREKAIATEQQFLRRSDPAHPPTGAFMDVPQAYWMSLQHYDQVKVARGLRMPMLMLQGAADFQVSPRLDFAQWKKVLAHDSRATFREYPGLSHLFMPAGKPPSMKDYMTPAHVQPRVIDDIAAWIKSQPARTH